jgi:hypothetical protein
MDKLVSRLQIKSTKNHNDDRNVLLCVFFYFSIHILYLNITRDYDHDLPYHDDEHVPLIFLHFFVIVFLLH